MWTTLTTGVLYGTLGLTAPAVAPPAATLQTVSAQSVAALPSSRIDVVVCIGVDLVLIKVGGIKIVIGSCAPHHPTPTPTPTPPPPPPTTPPPTTPPAPTPPAPTPTATAPAPTRPARPRPTPPAPAPAPQAIARQPVTPSAPNAPTAPRSPVPTTSRKGASPHQTIAAAKTLKNRRDPFRTVLVVGVVAVLISAGTGAIFRLHF